MFSILVKTSWSIDQILPVYKVNQPYAGLKSLSFVHSRLGSEKQVDGKACERDSALLAANPIV
jgi:hypothetical protein